MGLGFSDGFAPEDYSFPEPLTRLTEEFWDLDALRQEALEQKQGAYLFPTTAVTIRAVPLSDRTPELTRMFKAFIKKYGDNFGLTSCSYMYIDAGEEYPYHVDNVVGQRVSDLPPVLCTINILVEGSETAVEFKNLGEYTYKAAVFNTSVMHRITPKTDRIIARISFRELSYEKVVQQIKRTIDIDPSRREWEYSPEGIKIYKPEAGKPSPTEYEK